MTVLKPELFVVKGTGFVRCMFVAGAATLDCGLSELCCSMDADVVLLWGCTWTAVDCACFDKEVLVGVCVHVLGLD